MKAWVPAAAVAAVYVGIHLVGMNGPFLRHREGVTAFYAGLARTTAREGPAALRFGLVEASSPDLGVYPDWRRYIYPNRPPFTGLATAAWIAVFGDREWAVRLSLVVTGLFALAAFRAIALRLLERPWAELATGLFAFLPIFGYFSAVVVHLAYALAFSLGAWACRLRWHEGVGWRIGTGGCLVLACLSDWPGYFAALSIALDVYLDGRKRTGLLLLGLPAACAALHLLHLLWLAGGQDVLIRRFLQAGTERSPMGRVGVAAYLVAEARELGLYFTLGALALAAVGAGRLPRQGRLLALLGLEEVVFVKLAFAHDFLTYALAPAAALAAAFGARALASSARGRLAVAVLLALAGAQSAWILFDRLTREGATEVQWRAGLAIREKTTPRERTLITIADIRQFTPYYADRYTAGFEGRSLSLMVHPSAGADTLAAREDLLSRLAGFDWVLVGDPDAAARHIRFFGGRRPDSAFGFLAPEDPLRRAIGARARERVEHGAFVLYRMTPAHSPR